jgi:hypothetical protein
LPPIRSRRDITTTRDSKGLSSDPEMSVQMGAPSAAMRAHEQLFAYWASLRRAGLLPGRRDLDPAAITRLLPQVCLIDVLRAPRDYRLRLAGTGLYDVFGCEITGMRLGEIYNATASEYWRRELDKIVETARPGVGCHSLAWRGAAHMTILWMRLPLADNGRDIDRLLGYDAVVGLTGEGARAA